MYLPKSHWGKALNALIPTGMASGIMFDFISKDFAGATWYFGAMSDAADAALPEAMLNSDAYAVIANSLYDFAEMLQASPKLYAGFIVAAMAAYVFRNIMKSQYEIEQQIANGEFPPPMPPKVSERVEPVLEFKELPPQERLIAAVEDLRRPGNRIEPTFS